MNKWIWRLLAVAGLLLMTTASCASRGPQQEIKAFEEHIIEIEFGANGVVQTERTAPLAERGWQPINHLAFA